MALFDKLSDLAKNVGGKAADLAKNVGEKAEDFAKVVEEKANDGVETVKLKNKIHAEQALIDEECRKIGAYYYANYKSGSAAEPSISEMLLKIDEHQALLDAAQSQLDEIRRGSGSESQVSSTPPEADAASHPGASPTIICPACGKINPAETRFCSECGCKLQSDDCPQQP